MAAVGSMYKVAPLYSLEGSVTVSDVMYSTDRLYPAPNVQQNGSPLNLEERQEALLKKLDSMIAVASTCLGESTTSSGTSAINEILTGDCPLDLVIRADPSHPLRWLGQVKKHLDDKGVSSWWKFHRHSSASLSPSSDIFPTAISHQDRAKYRMIITVIWTGDRSSPSLHINPCQRIPIHGESNIFRFFGRLLGIYGSSPVNDAAIDVCLDRCDAINASSPSSKSKEAVVRPIADAVEKGVWFSGASTLTMAFLCSVLCNFGIDCLPESLKKWVRENSSLLVFS